jgi:hypothetical protein
MALKIDLQDRARIDRLTERGFRVLLYSTEGDLLYGKEALTTTKPVKAAPPPATPHRQAPQPHKQEVAKSTPRKRKAERD